MELKAKTETIKLEKKSAHGIGKAFLRIKVKEEITKEKTDISEEKILV